MSRHSANAPVLILAGGTGGHIFPGLAVAAALRARGVPVRWLGADGGMETRLVPAQGIGIDTIAIRGLRGKGVAALLAAPFKLAGAVFGARRILRRLRPRAVISFGGYASGPGGLAARLTGIPLLVHEQNRAPGLTNRVLARFARRVLTGFPETFADRAEEVVGNPVRAEITGLPPPELRFAPRTGALRLLVLGGSQGARALNTALPQALATLPPGSFQVRHQCGEKMLAEARASYDAAAVPVSLEPFIADMAAAYAWADLVVCRAGALTLAELCAAGVGSLLVPFPHAVDDHQTRNAEFLVERGAARLHPQGDALSMQLATSLQALAADPQRRLQMAQAARAIARPDAAERVARAALDVSREAAALENAG
ncbi:MAG: undecaprenyldiphospho-muramoylpentapeptide beta-N-acetylglucosaminyltransferase [Pseudoxanthomonas suwonensis]|nr:undecaprenyldiphospho-muramoylpentapeptide beta-N-acetylglucosaminyltransferase [Pseudoxanthomonas suwonensis]